jgi:hypothetical protein
MFPSSRTSALAQRALGALRVTRSFLMLEDDYDVDWEVDPNEHSHASHPHRVPLRGRLRDRGRRPGAAVHQVQPCLSPVAPVAACRGLAPRVDCGHAAADPVHDHAGGRRWRTRSGR